MTDAMISGIARDVKPDINNWYGNLDLRKHLYYDNRHGIALISFIESKNAKPDDKSGLKLFRIMRTCGMEEMKKSVIILAVAALVSLVLFIVCLPESVPVGSLDGSIMPISKTAFLPIDSKQWPKKYDGLFKK